MRILAFGYHDQTSARHWTMARDMLAEGIELVECHTSARGFWRKYRDLARQFRMKRRNVEGVLVTFPGHYLVPLAWILTRFPRRKLLFDAFLSLYDTEVHDRRRVSRASPKAWFLWMVDWLSMHMADVVFIDTQAHKDYLSETFHLRPDRIRVVYLGSRTDIFRPRKSQLTTRKSQFSNILFCGTFIPLQGIEHILRAAQMLQHSHSSIRFTLIGKGQTECAMRAMANDLHLSNVRFEPPVPYRQLPDRIRGADLCLGIFGTSGKAGRVIPHKVWDSVACGVRVVTADTPAIREKFANHPLVILCKAGDPEDLARTIENAIR
jgi:glycosyltransferase involved in cell wall biosynthesis